MFNYIPEIYSTIYRWLMSFILYLDTTKWANNAEIGRKVTKFGTFANNWPAKTYFNDSRRIYLCLIISQRHILQNNRWFILFVLYLESTKWVNNAEIGRKMSIFGIFANNWPPRTNLPDSRRIYLCLFISRRHILQNTRS